MKVAAYCRVSTDKNDQINSLQNQLQYFHSYIENHAGWELVEIFADEGTTGTSTKHRRAFHRMIQMAKQRKLDLILTKEVSRFARNTIDALSYTRQLKVWGVGVLFINDNINTLDNEGEFRLTIMASVAQEESRKISERVKWGQRRRMEQGIVFGNNSILGYTLQNGSLQVDPQQARIVQDIFFKYVDEGKGARVIAKELNQAGIRPVLAQHWSSDSVLNILKNEKYAGDLLQRKTVTPDFLNHAKKANPNAEDMIYLPNHHEAIIPRSKWDQAQKLIKARRRLPMEAQSKYSRSHWCSGKITCGCCGSRCVASQSKTKEGTKQTWLCSARKKYGARHVSQEGSELGCDNPRISSDFLLLCLNRALSHIPCSPSTLMAELLAELQRVRLTEDKEEKGMLAQKLLAIQKKKETLLLSYLDQLFTQEEFLQTKSVLEQEMKLLQRAMEQISEEECIQLQQQEGALPIQRALHRYLREEQATEAFFEQVVEGITLFPRRLEIRFCELPYTFIIQFRISRERHQYQVLITQLDVRAEVNLDETGKDGRKPPCP